MNPFDSITFMFDFVNRPVGSMCKKTCNKCGDTAAQCIDHSAICAFRATGPFKEASCSKDHIRRDCPMSCGACTVPPNGKLHPVRVITNRKRNLFEDEMLQI